MASAQDKTSERRVARRSLVGACLVAVVAVAVLIIGRQGDYTLHARFVDAGQLVEGGVVEVGGKRVGTITAIRLSDDNEADVVMRIHDDRFTPLHRGTVARIRAIGMAGVANRFVDLAPGPTRAPQIPDGGVLSMRDTRPIVDLDAVLNALDPVTRRRLQRVLRNSAKIFAGSTAVDANRALAYLNPALTQAHAVADELVRDEAALQRLVRSAGPVMSALASRRSDLEQGVSHTAAVLDALAGARRSLRSTLAQAPGVLRQGGSTLRDLRGTLSVLRPALREAQPVAPELVRLLRRLAPASRDTAPVLADLRTLLPAARAGLARLPALARSGLPALVSSTSALRAATPVFGGMRPYAPDIANGLFNGLAGASGAYYDANGHYIRAALNVPGNSGLLGVLGQAPAGGLRGSRSGLTARCPGGAVEPATDHSNPWVDDPALCNPEHDHR